MKIKDKTKKSKLLKYRMNKEGVKVLNSFLASGDFCCLLIRFANSLDLDQDRQNVGPGLDANYLTLLKCS